MLWEYLRMIYSMQANIWHMDSRKKTGQRNLIKAVKIQKIFSAREFNYFFNLPETPWRDSPHLNQNQCLSNTHQNFPQHLDRDPKITQSTKLFSFENMK